MRFALEAAARPGSSFETRPRTTSETPRHAKAKAAERGSDWRERRATISCRGPAEGGGTIHAAGRGTSGAIVARSVKVRQGAGGTFIHPPRADAGRGHPVWGPAL